VGRTIKIVVTASDKSFGTVSGVRATPLHLVAPASSAHGGSPLGFISLERLSAPGLENMPSKYKAVNCRGQLYSQINLKVLCTKPLAQPAKFIGCYLFARVVVKMHVIYYAPVIPK
jgi:hypothetical protein